MKIEKISENQIRCTLTRDDLASHEIKFSELTYGTEKAKKLFRTMMMQANYEVGFEVNNTPLMIEAIPLHSDGIVLIITKVEDPEELDTRFSKFAPDKENYDSPSAPTPLVGADDIIDIFQKLCDAKRKKRSDEQTEAPASTDVPLDLSVNLLRMFYFKQLDDVISAAQALNNFFVGDNSLYKATDDTYQLVLHKSGTTPEDFNKVCNMLSEYGQGKAFSIASEAHLNEHGMAILKNNALQSLASL